LSGLFGFDAHHIDEILRCLSGGISSIVGFEFLKLLPRVEPNRDLQQLI